MTGVNRREVAISAGVFAAGSVPTMRTRSDMGGVCDTPETMILTEMAAGRMPAHVQTLVRRPRATDDDASWPGWLPLGSQAIARDAQAVHRRRVLRGHRCDRSAGSPCPR